MNIPTHRKGDIALGMVIADLLKRGFNVFTPISTHACSYDLVASIVIDNKEQVLRVQVKYRSFQKHKYKDQLNPFDLFAVYYPEFDRVLYANFNVSPNTSIKISHQLPNSMTPFYWWEDFCCPIVAINSRPVKRTVKEFAHTITLSGLSPRKTKIPVTLFKLQKLLWKQSLVKLAAEFSMSDRALGKYIKRHNLVQPPSGYWALSSTKKVKVRSRYRELYYASLEKCKESK